MPRRGVLIYCAALLPIIPLLVGLGQELFQPVAWGPPGGDFTVLEIHLRDVARLKHWLGPYSRFGWNHPGPLYYYALQPLYWLSGRASWSLYASAALLSVIAAVGTVVPFFRERRSPWDRLLFALAFGAVVLDFARQRLPSDPWNPVVTVLPLAALCCHQGAASTSYATAARSSHRQVGCERRDGTPASYLERAEASCA